MLFTSRGQIYHEFLKYAGATLHYSTGYPISFFSPGGSVQPLHEYNLYTEPYEGYIAKQMQNIQKTEEMNVSHIVYLSYTDVLVYYPIRHHENYLGTVFMGPVKMIELESHKKDDDDSIIPVGQKEDILNYLERLPGLYQFQLQYITNLLNLVLHSSYYDPTVISTFQVNDKNFALPSADKLVNKISHHRIDQEDKILQRILLSEDSFKDLAYKNISKLSNLVAPPLADDPIRSEKNRFITSATIVSRAAIKLGLPNDIAFSYSDYFIRRVEDCTSVNEVWNMMMSLFMFYRREVKKNRSGSYNNAITNMLLLYIDEHIGENTSFQEICTKLDIDYKYASNCFKKDTGTGFIKYFTNIKMEKAKEQLETTDLLIQTIADNLGYANAYYFTRTFKSTYGISPAAYRKSSFNETE